MLKHVGRVVAAASLIAGGWGCAGDRADFEGTWQRVGLLDSTISLRPDEDGFHFRWRLVDGEKNIRCERDDFCEEFRGEDKVYEYRFRLEADGDAIVVRAEGRPLVSEMETVTWVDRMVLHDGGRELWTFLLEMNGERLDNPIGPMRFVRSSETPF